MIFVIADLHLGHYNVLKYQPTRFEFCGKTPESDPKEVLEAFESALIEKWNKVVSKTDTVYVLGDLMFSYSKDQLRDFLSKVNGIKHLVMGNHDTFRPSVYVSLGFESASRHPVFFNNMFLLSHYPIDKELVASGVINYFGHVHGNTSFNWERGQCVSIEQTDFAPKKIW